MQTKRKSEGNLEKSKFLKVEHNSSLTISSGDTDKSKFLKKNASKTPPKNIATRSSARLSRQMKSEKNELIETGSKSDDNFKPQDSVSISSTHFRNAFPKTSAKISCIETKCTPSSSKLNISNLPYSLPSQLSTTTHSTTLQNIANAYRGPHIPATSFYTNYCLINENNVDLMLHKSLNATYSMKVILMSLKEELKRLDEPSSCIRDTHLKKRRLLASKLVKAYSGYKHAVLNNLTIPTSAHILHSNILPQSYQTEGINKGNVSASHVANKSAKIQSKVLNNSDEVIELSEDSDDGATNYS